MHNYINQLDSALVGLDPDGLFASGGGGGGGKMSGNSHKMENMKGCTPH